MNGFIFQLLYSIVWFSWSAFRSWWYKMRIVFLIASLSLIVVVWGKYEPNWESLDVRPLPSWCVWWKLSFVVYNQVKMCSCQVRWSETRYFYTLGCVLCAQFWKWMVLVELGSPQTARLCWVYEEKLSTWISIHRFCSPVHYRVLWSK